VAAGVVGVVAGLAAFVPAARSLLAAPAESDTASELAHAG
jgi:hypothetical protein